MGILRALFARVPLGETSSYTPVAVRLRMAETNSVRSSGLSAEAELRERLSTAQQRIASLEEQVHTLTREAQGAVGAKDDFLASLSHELRTPLNATLGWIQLLRLHVDEPVMRDHAVDVLERNARAQVQTVSDLLDLSRIVTGRMHLFLERVHLADVVRRASESLAPAAQAKNVTLELHVRSIDPHVRGDRARLEQIVWNLVGNSLKFTPSGGRVNVTVASQQSTALIIVSDTGIGISPEKLTHVFEPLFQGDSSPTRAFGGLGLGLAIVRHLVELHGGSVRAESEGVGYGATFTARLPLAIDGQPTSSSPSNSKP